MPIPSYILPSAPAYTEDSVYALIPTPSTPIYTPDAISFTRGSDATRTASNGLIQRSPVNLASYSEDFSNAAWQLDGVTITSNQIASPTGTLTADLMTSLGTGQQRIYQTYTVSSGISHTISIYLKQGTAPSIQVVMPYVGGGPTFTFATATFSTVSGWTSSVETLPNGWYRISATISTTSAQAGFQLILPSNGSTVYLWGAQFTQGSQPLTYFPTTDRLNVPRIDFSQGSCPALLLEPQRTNLCLSSNSIGGTSWGAAYGGVGLVPTITLNYATAPDGTTSASRLQLSLGGGTTTTDQSLITQTLTATSTRGSFYIKTTDGSTQTIYMRGAFATNIVVTGTWTRYDFDAGTLTGTQFGLGLRGGQTPANSNTVDILVWGAQLEVGSYATTYIPTTTTSVTRLADSFSKSNIYTNGLITAAGGTWFIELRNNIGYTRDASGSFFIDSQNGGLGNGFNIRNVGTPNQRFVIVKYVSFSPSNLYFTLTDTVKIAIKWNGTTADVFVNGTKQVSGTSFTTTNMEFFGGNGNDQPKFIQQMALFSTPLSDAALITMTT